MSDADKIVSDEAQEVVDLLQSGKEPITNCAVCPTLVKGVRLSLAMLIPIYRRATAPEVAVPVGVVATTLAILRAVQPYRWPLAVAVFSPYGARLVGSIVSIWMTGKPIGTP